MRCYLLRHAEAVARGTPGHRRDDERPLTVDGHEQARQVAIGLTRLEIPVDGLLSSPLIRAQQTLQHIARAYKLEADVRQCDALRPEAEPAKTSAALREVADRRHVVLVGHEPHLSAWLGYLVTTDGGFRCVFKKAGVACVEIEQVPPSAGSGTLRWFLTPKQLMLIGKTE